MPTPLPPAAVQACLAALSEAQVELAAARYPEAFQLLERAHVLGQRKLSLHWAVHCAMLRVALAQRDRREIGGQLLRLLLTPLGHLFGRLPLGNTGGSRVDPFMPMPISDELRALLNGQTEQAPSRGIPENR
ncbi:DUF3703 domain-containing protein [Chitinimonas lacunae]|uniref:DUF3703 domain-containing protein n=1 Tax=Chitinimonas lacunae TaxID=1963018 RepID=A0ABV8MLX1_9NEIS